MKATENSEYRDLLHDSQGELKLEFPPERMERFRTSFPRHLEVSVGNLRLELSLSSAQPAARDFRPAAGAGKSVYWELQDTTKSAHGPKAVI